MLMVCGAPVSSGGDRWSLLLLVTLVMTQLLGVVHLLGINPSLVAKIFGTWGSGLGELK